MNTQILKSATRLLAIATLTTAAGLALAQNTIAARYGTPPSSGSDFTVKLINEGTEKTVSGFAFKIAYEPKQVEFKGIINNTGSSASGVQYTVGPETAHPRGGGLAQRIISATTLKDITNATNLAELKFTKKEGFAPPFNFELEDRLNEPVIDGLQSRDLENIPHKFDVSEVNQ